MNAGNAGGNVSASAKETPESGNIGLISPIFGKPLYIAKGEA